MQRVINAITAFKRANSLLYEAMKLAYGDEQGTTCFPGCDIRLGLPDLTPEEWTLRSYWLDKGEAVEHMICWRVEQEYWLKYSTEQGAAAMLATAFRMNESRVRTGIKAYRNRLSRMNWQHIRVEFCDITEIRSLKDYLFAIFGPLVPGDIEPLLPEAPSTELASTLKELEEDPPMSMEHSLAVGLEVPLPSDSSSADSVTEFDQVD